MLPDPGEAHPPEGGGTRRRIGRAGGGADWTGAGPMALVRRQTIAFTRLMSLITHSLSPSERAAVLAAERDGGPFLVYRDDYGDLRIVPLAATDQVRVGRNAGNDVVLDGDAEVSRAHAVLESAAAGWTVVDDGMSRNGTYVNGERVRRHRRLADHDVLRVGATSLLFRHPAMVVDDSTVAALAPPEGRITEAERRVLVAAVPPAARAGRGPGACDQRRDRRGALPVAARGQEPRALALREARRQRPAPEPQAGRARAAGARD